MTISEVIENYLSQHPTNNPNCNGEHCKCSDSKVRIIPLDDSCNVHLCSSCYEVELGYNLDRELEGLERILPDLPWEVYPVYFGDKQ